jgi:Bacterial sugar transferase/CoA-binding domain
MIKILGHYFHKSTMGQILVESAVMMLAAFFAVWLQASLRKADSLLDGTLTGVLVTLNFVMVSAALGLYERPRSFPGRVMLIRALVVWIASGLITMLILLLMPKVIDKSILLVFGILMLAKAAVLILQEATVSVLPIPKARILIYGSGKRAHAVAESLQRQDPSANLLGYFASPNERDCVVNGLPVFQGEQSLPELVREHQVDEIIVALNERRGGSMPMRDLLDCKLDGVHVLDIATHFERKVGQIRLDAMSAGYLIFGDGFEQGIVRSAVKRFCDIVGSMILLAITLPVMLLTAILIRLDSRGPIFYSQERVGRMQKKMVFPNGPSPETAASPASDGSSANAGLTSCRNCSACSRAT